MARAFRGCLCTVAFAFILGACALSPNAEGSFTVKIQTISQIVLDAIAQAGQNGSSFEMKSAVPKAYIAAQKVEFKLTEVGNPSAVLDSWTEYPVLVTGETEDELGQRTLPIGNYTLYATVYNNAADTEPCVGGHKDFTVTAGQAAVDNVVTVLCIPTDPIQLLSEDTDSAPYTLSEPWMIDYDTGEFSIGDEMWFEIAPIGDWTDLAATPSPGSLAGLYIFLFDGNGNGIYYMYPSSPGEPTSIFCAPTAASGHYYVGVIDVMIPEVESRAFTIRYAQSPGYVQLESSDYGADEDCGAVTISVKRFGSAGAVTVHYETSDDTATAGDDYTSVSGALSWSDCDDSDKTISIPIKDNSEIDAYKYFRLTISSPTGGARLGGTTYAYVFIGDDDGPSIVQFTIGDYSVNESDGSVTIYVSRTGGSGEAAEVTCTTHDSSAEAGFDYTATSTTLSWAAGDTTDKSFTVPILNDSAVEYNEAFYVVITTEDFYTSIGAVDFCDVLIKDDD